MSQPDEAWRRKPSFRVEECYTLTRDGMSRGIRYTIIGPLAQQYEDQNRILKGLVCANCMEPFPAKPSRETLRLFEEANIRYPREDWKQCIREERCPMCGDEVSYEYAALFDEGVLPTPEWMKE